MTLNIKFLLASFICCTSLIIACTSNRANTELASFSIEIVKTNDQIKLNCNSGCAWTELDFSLSDDQPQIVNQLGMSESMDTPSDKTVDDLSGFSFSISKSEDGIQLKGIQGTAWEALSFSLANHKPQTISQLGMEN